MDTLVGEFHEKFNVMWNAPGDRDAARALRQCDRTHREMAVQVVNEVLITQLTLLARTIAETAHRGGTGSEGVPESLMTSLESKIARLEEQITSFEQLVE